MSGSHGPNDEANAALNCLTYMVICLVIGLTTRSCLRKIPLPYTVLLLVWGIWIGVGQATYGQHLPYLSGGVVAWENINPEFFLAMFLPILLFASAFDIEWYTLRQVWWQAFTLAFPGVVIGTGITGVLMKYAFPYNWTWPQCLMFGAMMSATDPVAVVALLKEVGVDKRMRVVVDAEALLNDGSAFVFFLIMEEFVRGHNLSAGQCVKMLAQLSLGGPAFGLAIGLVVIIWLRFVYNDPLFEITLTIAAAFAAFIVGNVMLKVSGVLALVALGLLMSAHGGSHISKQVYHSLHVVWSQLEFMANTIIFVLSGTIIAARIIEAHQDNGITHILARDYGYAVLLWLMLIGVRTIIFAVLYPVLKVQGYGITVRQVLVYVWAGLRGAVGLSLAMFVLLDPTLGPYDMRVLMFFLLGMVALLTILVQGSTTSLLLQVLGLSKTPQEKKAFLENVLQRVEEDGETYLGGDKEDALLGEPRWDTIDHMCTLDYESVVGMTQSVVARQVKSAMEGSFAVAGASMRSMASRSSRASTYARMGAEGKVAMRLNRTALVQEMRSRYLSVVRGVYEETFQHGLLGNTHLYILLSCVDQALDKLERPLSDWKALQKHLALRYYSKRLAPLAGPASPQLMQRGATFLVGNSVRSSCQMVCAVLAAHTEAAAVMTSSDTWFVDQNDAGNFFFDRDLDQLVRDTRTNVRDQVVVEGNTICDKARAYLTHAGAAFPQVLADIRTHQVASGLLHRKRRYINSLARSGLLNDKEKEDLLSLVDKRMKVLELGPPASALPLPGDLLQTHPLTEALEQAMRHRLAKHAKLVVCNPGEVVAPSAGTCLLLVAGKLVLEAPPAPKGRKGGNWLGGVLSSFSSVRSPASSLTSQSTVTGTAALAKGAPSRGAPSDPGSVAERGAVLGLAPVLAGAGAGGGAQPQRFTAASMATALELPGDALREAMAASPETQERAWQYLAAQQAAQGGGKWCEGMGYKQLLWLFQGAAVKSLPAGVKWAARRPAFLAAGSLETGEGEKAALLPSPSFVEGDDTGFVAQGDCKLLLLSANYAESLPRPSMAPAPGQQTKLTPGLSGGRSAMAARRRTMRRLAQKAGDPTSPGEVLGGGGGAVEKPGAETRPEGSQEEAGPESQGQVRKVMFEKLPSSSESGEPAGDLEELDSPKGVPRGDASVGGAAGSSSSSK